jgi:hypothetical protein
VRLAAGVACGDDSRVEPAFDDRDVASILRGVFDINANLVEIRDELRVIRWLLEDGDGEEEEEEEEDPGHSS